MFLRMSGVASTVTSINPRSGSYEGATRITIYGKDFSPDQFNYGNENEKNGNRVYLRSTTATVECDVITYWSTQSTIYCDTRAAIPGDYYIYVTVDGKEVDTYCSNSNNCRFQYNSNRTPRVRRVWPRSGTPDSTLNFYGKIVTDIVTPSQSQADEYEDSNTDIEIQRIYMGSSICDPIDQDTGTVFGIDKASDGWGTIICKPNSTIVDSKNITFLVSSGWGRSYTESGAYSVSFGGELYLYQLHADIKGVTPNYGSYRGGTRIIISGKYFGTKMEYVAVDVGGVQCELVSVKDNAIECITGEQSSNQTTFPGNRGIYQEVRTDTYYFNRGYFVAPYDGVFKFMIYSDDQSELYFSMTENPENKVKIAFNSVAPGNNKLISDALTLTGGNHYYIEAYLHEGYGSDYINLGLMMFDLPISNADYSGAVNEEQTISITSTKNNEQQVLSINGGDGEVQEILLLFSNCSNEDTENEYVRVCEDLEGMFSISFMEETTASLSADATVNEVQDAINNLQNVTYSVSVNKTIRLAGNVFVIHFPSGSGNVQQLVGMSDNFEVESSTTVEGSMATIDSFAVKFDEIESASLSSSSTAEDFEEALTQMFTVQCQQDSESSGLYTNDYEGTASGYESGARVMDVEPYCGRASLKNPNIIYEAGGTESSNGETVDVIDAIKNGKVCFAYNGALSQKVRFTIRWKHYDDGDQRSEREYRVSKLTKTTSWHYTCFDIYSYIQQDEELNFESSPDSPFDVEVITLYQDGGDFYIDNLNIGSSEIKCKSLKIKIYLLELKILQMDQLKMRVITSNLAAMIGEIEQQLPLKG
ncbi:fibrocystin-L-like [Antedon mediterranea]|uniref:fibrocystin-L-like n=1 Tax=Antedon mediterranea TaxID=105859 RepID=UPI003AF545F9